MAHRFGRKALVGALLAATVAGGAVAAVTATGHGAPGSVAGARTPRHPAAGKDLTTAANYLGLSIVQLQSDLRSGRTLAEIANTTAGKSEAGLIQTLVTARLAASAVRLPQRVKAEVNRPIGAPLAVRVARFDARSYLGLTQAQLKSDLASGRTLAEIANATAGKSEAGLIEGLVAVRTEQLAAAVAVGRLSKASENVRLAHLDARVSALVNRTLSKKASG